MDLGTEALYSPDLGAVARFGSNYNLLLVFSWEVVGRQNAEEFMKSLAIWSFVLPVLQYAMLLLNTAHMLYLYKARMLDMRRGVYFMERGSYEQYFCSRFSTSCQRSRVGLSGRQSERRALESLRAAVGFQVAGNTLYSFVVCGVIGVCIGFPVTMGVQMLLSWLRQNPTIVVEKEGENGIEFVEISATEYFGQEINNLVLWLSVSLPGLVIAYLVQYICGHYVFFTADKRTRWLRYRYFYALYDCAPVHQPKVSSLPLVSPMPHGSMCACV